MENPLFFPPALCLFVCLFVFVGSSFNYTFCWVPFFGQLFKFLFERCFLAMRNVHRNNFRRGKPRVSPGQNQGFLVVLVFCSFSYLGCMTFFPKQWLH